LGGIIVPVGRAGAAPSRRCTRTVPDRPGRSGSGAGRLHPSASPGV